MASSDGDVTSSSEREAARPTPPTLEELSRIGVRRLLLPWIVGLAATSAPSEVPREVMVLVNLRTGSITMAESGSEGNASGKDGPLPASKASIEAMPEVEVEEEGLECAICLSEFQVNGELAKEMPCKHRYHPGCIKKWLGIHGSCPICRYKMPAEEEPESTKGGDNDNDNEEEGEGEGAAEGDGGDGEGRRGEGIGGGGFVFHIFLTGSRMNQSGNEMGSDSDSDTDAGRNDNEEGDGDSGSGSGEEDDGSAASQDMDID